MPTGIASICNAAARPYRVDSTDPMLTATVWLNANHGAPAMVCLDANSGGASGALTNLLSLDNARPMSATDGDRLDRFRRSARCVPTRTLGLSCNLGRERRSADNSTLTCAWRSTTLACSAQFAVQP